MGEQVIQVVNKKSNGLGTAGFVLALIGLIFCWVPVLGIIMLFLGLIFSLIGFIIGLVSKKPIGLSIAGVIISIIDIIIVVVVFASFLAILGLSL